MVESVELPRLLDRLDVGGVLDDADQGLSARCASAVKARIAVRNVVTDGAFADFFLGLANGVGKRQGLSAVCTQQIKGQPLGGFLADARQPLQFVDQSRNGRSKISHGPGLLQTPRPFRYTRNAAAGRLSVSCVPRSRQACGDEANSISY